LWNILAWELLTVEHAGLDATQVIAAPLVAVRMTFGAEPLGRNPIQMLGVFNFPCGAAPRWVWSRRLSSYLDRLQAQCKKHDKQGEKGVHFLARCALEGMAL